MMFSMLPVPPEVADPARLAALDSLLILDTPPEEGFDDIVQLAASACEVPVALVSLVTGDRQWFKARVGFPPCETDLGSSVCAHALAEPDLLVIADLATDPRSRANPLVVGAPHIRFYAGAPLRTSDGLVIGSLCVIDVHPRPGGLTAKQAADLRALGRQVMSQIELRRLLQERDAHVVRQQATERRLAASEAYWRGLFQHLQEGLIIGRVERNAAGRVVDWRHIEVNRAWATLTGLAIDSAVGRTARELVPGIDDEWIDEPGYVVDTGEAVTFTRRSGKLGRWFEGRVSPLGPETFIMLFLDVTDRVAVEQALAASTKRKAALGRLGDQLRATLDANAITYSAAAITGQTVGAAQAAYAVVDAAREVVRIDTSWHAPGFESITGSYSFRDYGSYIEELKAGRTVIVADVELDERTRDRIDAFRDLGVAGLVNVPVIEHGNLVAIFLALFAEPRRVTREEEEFMRAAVDRTRAGIARVRADERQAVINGEISHRLKNTLAMVQAIASQTLKGASDREAVAAFDQRLMALATAHDVLLQNDWDAADLAAVVRRVLEAGGAADRFDADGPAAILGPRAALSTSLLLHELATNAAKYGALSSPGGRIEVRWRLEDTAGVDELVLNWREVGGPATVEPTRKGFGSRLLRMGLVGTGGSKLSYGETGLEATFRAPRTQVEQA